ncbi:uncharacterized protein LOC113321947 isoform X2 [Papaver somniferum]|uniref:uncharacterized protein LOC113321947 isoform X1 n=1 Tax=Papaver somniferum TaxID=3469 RepID=UPI000E7009A4|nr:uncharacterized protein LOC113321947 isoform X1 [Papaver somniferum]XP_026425713.1 uncharacterized protein LOC113321947 isoform X2 [Papaver somniferum]
MQQIFTPTEVTKIKEIHIPAESEEHTADKLLWTYHPKGDFSTKSFLKTLNDRTPSTSTNNVFPWKKFWSVRNIPPRIQLFVWRMLKNGLHIARNIKKHIHGINDDCRLCDRNVECIEHLFLYCQLTQAVLFTSPLSLRIGKCPNQSVKDIIIQWMEEGGDYAKLKMGMCVFWTIWKGRNGVVFNKKKFNIIEVIQEALYWYNMKLEVEINKAQPTENDLMEAQKDYWEPPAGDKIKINFDGAAGPRGFACGVVARDKEAKIQGCRNKTIDYCTAVEAEAYSALLAAELGLEKVS